MSGEKRVSYVKEFTYRKKDGTESKRRVLVMRESATAFDGIDLGYLDEAESKEVQALFKDHEIGSLESHGVPKEAGSTPAPWMKAWRRFNIVSIIEPL